MNIFMLGILAGIIAFAVVYSVFMLNKIHSGLIILHQVLDAQGKAAQLLFLKINKIEKVTNTTMHAAETFVDALRESAEHMSNLQSQRNDDDSDQFDDLRKTFDEGIRHMEDEDEDDEEENNRK